MRETALFYSAHGAVSPAPSERLTQFLSQKFTPLSLSTYLKLLEAMGELDRDLRSGRLAGNDAHRSVVIDVVETKEGTLDRAAPNRIVQRRHSRLEKEPDSARCQGVRVAVVAPVWGDPNGFGQE